MSLSEAAQIYEEEAKNEQGESPRLDAVHVASSTERLMPQECQSPGGSERSDMMSITDMANVGKLFNGLLRNPRSSSDKNDEETSEENMSEGINVDALVTYLLGVSIRVSWLRRDGSSPEELMQCGTSWCARFVKSGTIEELDEAIKCWSSVAALATGPDAEVAAQLSNLACTNRRLFEIRGKLANNFDKLGSNHCSLFRESGEVADLNEAIECGMKAVSLTPDGHADKPRRLENLRLSHETRFERLGEVADLNNAIECGAQAISLTPDGDEDRPIILNNLGLSYRARFDRLDEVADLNKAIECGTEAVSVTHNGHTGKPSMLCNLGVSYRTRFKRLREVADLNKAIECGMEAVSLTPDGHTVKSIILDSLGLSYRTRFGRLDGVADLNKAIDCGMDAVSLTPDGHADKPAILNNLGNSYLTRFGRLGEVADLNKAIECEAEAISLTPDSHADKPGRLNNLGNSYRTRFERLGEVADLSKAIGCGVKAVLLTPDGHEYKPGHLSMLGASYLARFERLGEVEDLDKATECGMEAVSLSPNDHTDRSAILSKLGESYHTRFDRIGEVIDLNKAIECGVEVVSLTPEAHVARPGRLSNLGGLYLARFNRLGEVPDLNKAIDCGVEAVSFAPDDRGGKRESLSTLGMSYLSRFRRFGELGDLDKAIEYGVQVVSLTPAGHVGKPGVLSNLGLSYRTRFEELGDVADLSEAIKCGAEAVSLSPDGHAERSSLLSNLGGSYILRFNRLGGLADLNEAIDCGVQAVLLTPDGHPAKSSRLNNLAFSHKTRFERLGQMADLNKAIEYGEEVVSVAPDGHADEPTYLNNLGKAYQYQFFQSHLLSDLDSAIAAYRASAQSLVGSPSTRLKACISWARLASYHPMSSSFSAYLRAMELLPQFVWIGNTLGRRYSLIASLGDFATEAAAFAISIGNLEIALEWLEAGRSIIWGQASQLRTSSDILSSKDPDLAKRLKDIGFQLEHVGSRSSVTPAYEDKVTHWHLNREASNHVQLALEWDMLLERARSIPGLEDFLKPCKSSQLLSASKSHPIAVINIHESRCDALILQPNCSSISHIPLINFSVATGYKARECIASLAGQRGFTRVNECKITSPESALKDLWLGVVKPILESLGYMHKSPAHQLPRITWCATGVLSFLPLHAAGDYNGSQASACELVVSSYTPSISSLLASQSGTRHDNSGVLAVGQEYTPGFINLPYVRDELSIVKKHSESGCYLQLENEEATVAQVLGAMDQFGWLHMACHGTQDAIDPTRSAFHLHDGSLTLAQIAKQSFTNKGLAFLSACQTATGHKELPDEAVHLAAGLLMAGYPSVIGTMWSIADEDGPEVADRVYAELLKDGAMDSTNSAMALHQAVVHLRAKVGEKAIMRWAPFIHIGC